MDNEYPEVPRVFYSEYSEEPFATCVDCECDLAESGIPYVVQKQYVGSETVFEMAMCVQCQQRLNEQVSDQSRQAFQKFFEQERQTRGGEIVIELDPGDPESMEQALREPHLAMLKLCLFCSKPRSDCHRHGIVGLFQNGRLLVHASPETGMQCPLSICEDCNLKLNERVSKQTRDMWDRFVGEHFDCPPGIEEDWPAPDLMML